MLATLTEGLHSLYLTNTLTAIVNGHKQALVSELLPWNFYLQKH